MAEQMTEPEDRQRQEESAAAHRGVDLPDQERFARTAETGDEAADSPGSGSRSSSCRT